MFETIRTVAPCGADLLVRWAGRDASEAFISAGHSAPAQALLNNFCVGVLEEEQPAESSNELETLSFTSCTALEK